MSLSVAGLHVATVSTRPSTPYRTFSSRAVNKSTHSNLQRQPHRVLMHQPPLLRPNRFQRCCRVSTRQSHRLYSIKRQSQPIQQQSRNHRLTLRTFVRGFQSSQRVFNQKHNTDGKATEDVKTSSLDATPHKTMDERREQLRENAKESVHGIKKLWKKYGMYGVGIYFGVYFGTIGLFYLALSSSLVSAKDAIFVFKTLGVDRFMDLTELNPKAGNFALAWILTKLVEPLRLGFTILITPPISRLLRARSSDGEPLNSTTNITDGSVDVNKQHSSTVSVAASKDESIVDTTHTNDSKKAG